MDERIRKGDFIIPSTSSPYVLFLCSVVLIEDFDFQRYLRLFRGMSEPGWGIYWIWWKEKVGDIAVLSYFTNLQKFEEMKGQEMASLWFSGPSSPNVLFSCFVILIREFHFQRYPCLLRGMLEPERLKLTHFFHNGYDYFWIWNWTRPTFRP